MKPWLFKYFGAMLSQPSGCRLPRFTGFRYARYGCSKEAVHEALVI